MNSRTSVLPSKSRSEQVTYVLGRFASKAASSWRNSGGMTCTGFGAGIVRSPDFHR